MHLSSFFIQNKIIKEIYSKLHFFSLLCSLISLSGPLSFCLSLSQVVALSLAPSQQRNKQAKYYLRAVKSQLTCFMQRLRTTRSISVYMYVCVRVCVCLSLRSHSWLRDTARRCAIQDTVTAEDTDTTERTISATVTVFTDTDTATATQQSCRDTVTKHTHSASKNICV